MRRRALIHMGFQMVDSSCFKTCTEILQYCIKMCWVRGPKGSSYLTLKSNVIHPKNSPFKQGEKKKKKERNDLL